MGRERGPQAITGAGADFESIRRSHSLYVDKTGWLHRLITDPGHKTFFIARPGGFGKTLMLSTLEAIFQGRRRLFKGLAIDQAGYDWKTHPVVHLDASKWDSTSPSRLRQCLLDQVRDLRRREGIPPMDIGFKYNFGSFLEELHRKRGRTVVVLVDEYFKPVLDNLAHPDRALEIWEDLRYFYGVVKAWSDSVRFVMLTGAGESNDIGFYPDLDIFSSLTMRESCGGLLGYTRQELETCFPDQVDAIAARQGIPRQELLDRMWEWYGGYQFGEHPVEVCNPGSIAGFLAGGGEFRDHWFQEGTPSFLLPIAGTLRLDSFEPPSFPVPEGSFSILDLYSIRALAALYLSGCLTIRQASPLHFGYEYELDFPNRETRDSFGRLFRNPPSPDATSPAPAPGPSAP